MQKTIIDELCVCGHKKSEHCSLYSDRERGFVAKGHGKCKKCSCPKFTWNAYILDDGTMAIYHPEE